MNILVIGSGGREHAIIRSLLLSSNVKKIYCLPGREGFGVEQLGPSWSLDTTSLMKKKQIDLVIIGPEKELTEGLSDLLRKNGFLVFGPSREASQLEGSKIFSKDFMNAQKIPTSKAFVVENREETMRRALEFRPPYVLKADGLAAGKGVFICEDKNILKQKAKALFEEKILGAAGAKALLEEFQKGRELSVFIFTNGRDAQTLPLAQDYKKRNDGGLGPNTGGMGAISPILISDSLMKKIQSKIIEPTLLGLQKRELLYFGVLYIGLMIVDEEPLVLEYNVRFGDPECQAILPLIEGDMGRVFYELAQGRVPQLQFKKSYSCCVVLSEKGYPDHPKKGAVMAGDLTGASKEDSSYILHAGTAKGPDGRWFIDGGRVLNAVALGPSIKEAKAKAYGLVEQIKTPDLFYRKDIGSF